MAKQRYINTKFWDDGYIVTLDPIEKLLFLYLLTNPLTEISGAYEIPLRRIAFDTGIDADMVKKIISRFEESRKIIYRDGWVLVCNFIKHQSTNPNVQKGMETAVSRCPDWIKDRLSIAYQRLSHLNPNHNPNLYPDVNNNAAPAGADYMSGRAGIPRTMTPVNESSDRELNEWLDELAKLMGLNQWQNIAQLPQWRLVCMKAIGEGFRLDELLDVYRTELARVGKDSQYLTPEGVLKKLHSGRIKITSVRPKWDTPTP